MKSIIKKSKERERGERGWWPATLLAKPLFETSHNDSWGLGVHGTNLVPGIVSLGSSQIYIAALNLTSRRLSRLHWATPSLLWRRRRWWNPSSCFGPLSCCCSCNTDILKVDFVAKLQAIKGLSGRVGWRGGRGSCFAHWTRRTHCSCRCSSLLLLLLLMLKPPLATNFHFPFFFQTLY